MINVKSVVLLAAEMLGMRERVENFLKNGGDSSDQRVVDGLVSCYNLVETEIATDRLPIVVEDTLKAESGKIAYGRLSMHPAYVISVLGAFGQDVDYTSDSTGLLTGVGTFTVRYAGLPSAKTANDDCEYQTDVQDRTLAYGVAAEYCLHTGAYAEHAVWEKKYREGLVSACRLHRSRTVKVGEWV